MTRTSASVVALLLITAAGVAFLALAQRGQSEPACAGVSAAVAPGPARPATRLLSSPVTPTTSEAPGIPAIEPDRVVGTTGPRSPAFTLADVCRYVAANGAIDAAGPAAPTVTGFRCLRPAAAGKLVGDSSLAANRAPNDLVCAVTLHGHFAVSGPPTVHMVGFGTLAYDLFGGDTGNLLGIVVYVSGTRSR